MTREEAIQVIQSNGLYYVPNNTPVFEMLIDAFDMAIEALKAQQWIPCSERLPETNGAYLIQCKDTRHLMIVEYWNGYWNAHEYCQDYAFTNVIAWMPLPELYEYEEEPDAGKDLS